MSWGGRVDQDPFFVSSVYVLVVPSTLRNKLKTGSLLAVSSGRKLGQALSLVLSHVVIKLAADSCRHVRRALNWYLLIELHASATSREISFGISSFLLRILNILNINAL